MPDHPRRPTRIFARLALAATWSWAASAALAQAPAERPASALFAEADPPPSPLKPGVPRLADGSVPREISGPIETIRESLFGDATGLWRPLTFRTFFTEGWNEAWEYPTSAEQDAPRQGWINAFDGVFYRLYFTSFTYFADNKKNGSQYVGDFTIFAPLNRRFEVRIDAPFVVSNKGGPANNYHNNFGDLTVTPRFLLSESRNLSQVFSVFIGTPTGRRVNTAGNYMITPQYEFWYGDLPSGWSIRGGLGVSAPLNEAKGRTLATYNLAAGKYWTPHDVPIIGDFVTYLVLNGSSTIDRGATGEFASLTPGFRTHLGNDWYALGGVQMPLVGPRSGNYAYAPTFWLMKVF